MMDVIITFKAYYSYKQYISIQIYLTRSHTQLVVGNYVQSNIKLCYE